MTKEDKELLLKDISARLPYSTLCYCKWTKDAPNGTSGCVEEVSTYLLEELMIIGDPNYECQICEIKPYLRPMSSMTEEERLEFSKLLDRRYCEEDWEGHISTSYCIEIDNVYTDDEGIIKYPSSFSMDAIDWLNEHYFDYRGLIEKGFALEAPEGMYKSK